MLQKLKKQESGFSIVEVMIVLAIAGLIILVIFLAVPALQRNARNSASQNEASAVAAAVGEHRSSANGALPTAATYTVTNGTLTLGNASAQVNNLTSVVVAAGTTAVTPTLTTATVRTGVKCGNGGNGAAWTPVASAGRSAAVIFAIETSGGTIANCIDA